MISLSHFNLAADHIPFTLMGLFTWRASKCTQVIFRLAISIRIFLILFLFSPYANMSLYSSFVPCSMSQFELSHLFLFNGLFDFNIAFQLSFCTGSLICIRITILIHLRSIFISTSTKFRYILQMYQGVFAQCRGVAHKLNILKILNIL